MTVLRALHAVFTAVGAILAIGGGATAIAYGVFRLLGRSWIDQHFKKQLEKLKHDQQREVEQLRHEINSLFSRISKIHEKEFEILPKAWHLLHEAQARVLRATALGGKEVPDLNRMAGPQFDEWLANCRLPAQFQRDELRQAEDRTTHYQQALYWIDLEEAKAAQVALHNYLIENSIFMTNDLRLKFRAIDSALAKALSDHEIGVRRQSPDLIDTSSKILSHLSDLFAEVESAVQKRLRYDEA